VQQFCEFFAHQFDAGHPPQPDAVRVEYIVLFITDFGATLERFLRAEPKI
jgi:hypothetical protein